jgi:hypothetical protein
VGIPIRSGPKLVAAIGPGEYEDEDEERGVYLLIDLTIGEVELAEPNDVKRLHVAVAHGSDRDAVARLLARTGAGRFVDGDDDHVWVSEGWLRERAEGRVSGRWSEGFDHMVSKAREHGWIDDDGNHLRAHVEWIASDDGLI